MIAMDPLDQVLLDFAGRLPWLQLVEFIRVLRASLQVLPESLAIAILTFVIMIILSFISLK